MKKHIFLIVFILGATIIQAQVYKEKVKTIEVTGKAEIEVVPDEIYLQLVLKEYKKGNNKVTINALEELLIKALKNLNIDNDNLTVENVYGYNWNWKKKKANDDFMATKSFKLKLSQISKVNDLVSELDEEGINSMGINQYDHSNIENIRADLKVKAIKAAKTKAKRMLEAIDEELGGAIHVSEIDSTISYPQNNYRGKSYSNIAFDEIDDREEYKSDVGFKKIKLDASIKVVFNIK